MHYQNKCHLCGLCVSLADGHIRIVDDKLFIDREACVDLPEIAELCPYEAYETVGRYYSPEELVTKLLRDEVFYRRSGGGITFSGGEAALYPEYLLEVAEKLKEHDISLALDTAGLWEREKIMPLLKYLDLVLFDVKTIDSDLHKRLCGVGNEKILANLKWLIDKNVRVIGRLVLVPNANDDLTDVKKRFELLSELKIEQVDILYYHQLGLGKYYGLGIDYPFGKVKTCSDEYKEKVKELAAGYSPVITYSE